MKTLLIALAFALTSGAVMAKDEDGLASYYLTTPEKYDGQTITLDCAKVERINASAKDGNVKFFVLTAGKNFKKSYITAIVPLEESDSFISEYGTEIVYRDAKGTPKTKPISGKLTRAEGDTWKLEYKPSK